MKGEQQRVVGRGVEITKALGAAVRACSRLQDLTLNLEWNQLGLGLGSPGVLLSSLGFDVHGLPCRAFSGLLSAASHCFDSRSHARVSPWAWPRPGGRRSAGTGPRQLRPSAAPEVELGLEWAGPGALPGLTFGVRR